MDIKVITRHAPSNYGSVLQAIATVKVLEDMGHNASIIDYERLDERAAAKVKTEGKMKYASPQKQLAYNIIRYPIERYAEKRFDAIRRRYIKMTPVMHTHEDLAKLKADVFMTGSDQVWGPMVNGEPDSAYFLSFVPEDVKKVAYSGSFGRTKFDLTTVEQYKKLLTRYDKIAVREDSAVKMLHDWGLTNCIGQVLDPTLLLDKQAWLNLLGIKDEGEQPYVLVYQIHNDANLSAYAKSFSAHKNLKLKRVSASAHQIVRGGQFCLCPDIKDFIRLLLGAKYVVTDSFHGTCFSLILQKQFIEILPNNATGTRNMSILQLTGLSNRIMRDFTDYSLGDQAIDYSLVNDKLSLEREHSLQMMHELLK